jgi:integrase
MYLRRIGLTYYFRVRIPADLLAYFPLKEIRKSLKTKHKAHAKSLAKKLSFKTDRVFSLIRSAMLTDSEIRKLVDDHIHKTLADCEEMRATGSSVPKNPDDLEDLIDTHALLLSDMGEDLMFNNLKAVEHTASWLIEDNSLPIEKGSDDYKKFCRELLKAATEIQIIEIERMKGNYNNDYDKGRRSLSPTVTASDATTQTGMLLSEAIDLFVKEKSLKDAWRPKTKDENESIFALLIGFMGDIDIKTLDRSVLLGYSDALSRLPSNMNKKREYKGKSILEVLEIVKYNPAPPLSTRTRNKHLERVSSLFKWCVQQGYMDRNSAESLSTKEDQRADKQRDAYSTEDLNQLLDSPIYTTNIPTDKPERFWIPLIALFSGLRLEEICQLYLDDIIEQDKVPCFDINNKADKKLKSLASERVVPIHPTLLKTGFLGFVNKLKAEGKTRLWENLTKGRDGYSSLFGKWYQRHNRAYVTMERKRVFHSFRHNLADNLKQREVPETIIAEIVGHAQESITTGRYGKRYKPAVLLEALKKIDYQANMSHLIKLRDLWKGDSDGG